jgi:Tol biopolymer transport system component
MRSLDALDARPLEGTEGASYPFWSPDSRSIGFFADGKLKRIDVSGGPSVTLCDAFNGRGGTWNRDDVIVFAPEPGGPLFRVGAGGGEPGRLTKTESGGHRHPSFLPDGRHFLYVNLVSTARPEVWLGELDSTESRRLLVADSNAIYAEPGELLFVREDTLLRQPFDLNSLALTGDPMPIAEQVAVGQYAGAFSVSNNGVLTYRTGPRTAESVQLAWFDRTGKLIEALGAPGNYRGVELSPDGTRLAVHRHDSNGGDIWILDLARRGTLSRFTFDASQENTNPIWSPDASRIAFASTRNGRWGVYEKTANGSDADELLVESELPIAPMAWSSDNRYLVYWELSPKTNSNVWVLPLGRDQKPLPLLHTTFSEQDPQISPDGKWVAYLSNESGSSELYVRPFPKGDGKWQISSTGASFVRWRADGTELFYLTTSVLGKLMSVRVNPAGVVLGYREPTELFDSGYVDVPHAGPRYHPFAVSPDGQRFLIARPDGTIDVAPTPITVIVNWPSLLNVKQ